MTEQVARSPLPAALERLRGQLVVSVQADDGSPLREVVHIVALSRAALLGGAAGLRLRSAEDIRAVRAMTDVPIIGLTKQAHPGTDVYITATPGEVREVAAAGADIVAFDGTDLPRPYSVAKLIEAAHAAGALAMADVSTLEEARAAYAAGADIVGTTMSGYTPHSPQLTGPDFALMEALAAAGLPFIAEGRINSPELAAAALQTGALCVVVGSAITRPDHVTRWFAAALRSGTPGA
ncbi:N-acetylmannosamine-6-phosphate 2-epimerase [Deinococcus puniceus]|uniref:Putative N-acetylmannosamine-6-phosphate 2-epimerase n=1 Tax=Deinococcus puniceus TaxID=1182568 RepID=A0A172T9E4_9DEIO|nr:putative N-acetylmannosamine-6-phosphate 2-epimerase [Deinococcus puniceus]ANE43630.1 N-acetylmannosamine-6-phosphate 2-epimerase [Deinococcus puniceus]